ncbi:DNA primase [Halorhabdus sp. CBA1104]|uniref:DNA primase DnaG n=1 Tax=Halorhabdus sp. CBA1104 TaxID=1380432 RepID=UPI0012B2AA25|nr:DNA primase DnaG [Halorhabdus sp. CBA1104]QGN07646.1 DNA primase [Halorhabdus sp. CBA1104]
MQDSSKYLIHAQIEANGVVERSDVVGAIFGQTEGLLGDDLDLRTLQESSKVGRIDVEVQAQDGQSRGNVTIASGLDRVETAILAASLESIDRVGPCRADVEVTELEDVRTAKRRAIVDRAEELLAAFDEEAVTSEELVEEVRRRVRVDRITDYEGLPAGPRVANSDAIVVVEGRADVTTLLEYGIKNAVAVEGTDVPDSIAELTQRRTVTAFLDGDRGGDLILKELAQVGSVDYVAFAPAGRSVEDLSRSEVTGALQEKVPAKAVTEETIGRADSGDASAKGADGGATEDSLQAQSERGGREDEQTPPTDTTQEARTDEATSEQPATRERDGEGEGETETEPAADETLDDHVQAVIGDGTAAVRLLDDSLATLAEAPAEEAFEAVRGADPVPATVVLDGAVTQRLLDVAAQRGVGRIVAADRDEFVKQPTSVRVSTVEVA